MFNDIDVTKEKWGFLRETKELATKAGIDADTGLHRTGLEEYLTVIFPNVTDWVHDKTVDTIPKELKCRKRPDYRSETLKLIIEFDGTPHYTEPKVIRSDVENTKFYERFGYKVVRIPFFIQLTNQAIKEFFGVDIAEPMFNASIPSIGIGGANPANICWAGLCRMAKEFRRFPEQYATNLKFLRSFHDDYITGAELLNQLYASTDLQEVTLKIV